MTLPIRKLLPHGIPLWIDSKKETYFITICCEQRGKNQLALDSVANALFATVAYRNATSDLVRQACTINARPRSFYRILSRQWPTDAHHCQQVERVDS